MEIAPIEGLVTLQNEFSGEIKQALKDLDLFTEETMESLGAVAGAAGLIGSAFLAIGAATIALGDRGADINDLEETIESFSATAHEADEAMDALREGTLGTVTNFDLAKNAAHLLSAGVKLTADDFSTLSSAAFILQNRGLGGTKEMLDMVSDAMVTGRTRSLAMALGIIDVGNAEDALAKKLDSKVSLLSESAKVEAKRAAIMEMLSKAVSDAGDQERDFGEELEASRAFMGNWVDELAEGVADSERFAGVLTVVKQALMDAFGGDSNDSINQTVGFLEGAASAATTFGLAALETARVVHAGWSVIETVVLGVATGISGLLEVVTMGTLVTREFTLGMDAQTQAAAQGIIQNSAFDDVLDSLGGTLFQMRDALNAVNDSTKEHNESVDIAAQNAKQLKMLNDELNKSMLDRGKVEEELAKIEKKSVEDTKILWNELFALRRDHSFSGFDSMKGKIDEWAQNEVAKLKENDRNWQQHYDAIQAVAKEKLEGISVDWDHLRENSIITLKEQVDVARNTYNEMVANSHLFTREALAEQKQAVKEAEMEVRGMGAAYVEAQEAAKKATMEATEELQKQAKAAKEAAEAARRQGGSFSVTAANIDESSRGMGLNPEVVKQWASLGYSFEHALAFARKFGPPEPGTPEGPGPRIPGFFEGGHVEIGVGERGPETVRVPLGSTVFPGGQRSQGDSNKIEIHSGAFVLQYPIGFDQRSMTQLVDMLSSKIVGDQAVFGRRN